MNAHGLMVSKLAKPGRDILKKVSSDQLDLVHAVLGISGESGELVDAVKKHVIYCKEIDRENIIEELGDLEFYMEQLRQNLGITRKATIKANMVKLAKRYPGYKYTNQRAKDRADKQ